MRAIALFIVVSLLAGTSCHASGRQVREERVLFVGNSLTYVGNVPAVFAALSNANGKSVAADMIVRGGATLTQRVTDGSVSRALDGKAYTALVLQERGGDLMCSFSPDPCAKSRQAIKDLAGLAERKGVKVVLLGTYQSLPSASRRLVESESEAAAEAGIAYIEVSEKLQRLRSVAPELTWFATDGMHPGKDLALLNAVLVHQALTGVLPAAKPFVVSAPIYGSTSGLEATVRPSDARPPMADTPLEARYPAQALLKIFAAIGNADG